MPRYSHMFDIAFTVMSENNGESITADELIGGIKRRVKDLCNSSVEETIEACGLPHDTYEIMPKFECDNCEKLFYNQSELKNLFPNIPYLFIRVSPGEVVPAGECIECGAFVYPIKKEKPVKVIITVNGGIVQYIAANTNSEALILDFDRSSAEDPFLARIEKINPDKFKDTIEMAKRSIEKDNPNRKHLLDESFFK